LLVAFVLGCSDDTTASATADASGEGSSGTTTTSVSNTSTGGSDTGEEEPTYAVVVLRGVGDGTLLPPVEYPLALSPNSNTAVVRRSGQPDVLAVDYQVGQGQTLESGVCVYEIDGDRLEQLECHVVSDPDWFQVESLRSADLDGDDLEEIVYTRGSDLNVLWVGSGDPPETFTFDGPEDQLQVFGPLAIADVDGDARDDIVFTAQEGGFDAVIAYWVVRAWLGPSGLEATVLRQALGTQEVRLADLTGDGIVDLLLDGDSPDEVPLYPGDGTIFAEPILVFPVDWMENEVFAPDIDGDGQADVAFARRVAESPDCVGTHVIDWWRGPFGDVPPMQTIEGTEFREGNRLPTIVDLDGDSVAELVSAVRGACPPEEGTSILRLAPSPQVEIGPALCTDCTLASESQAMDVDGDGHLDLVAVIERP